MSLPPAATRYREICPAFTPQWENLTHARSAKCPIVSPSTMSSTAKEPAPAHAMRTKDVMWAKWGQRCMHTRNTHTIRRFPQE